MKFNNIKVVMFDIDGTLLDTSELIFKCYEYTFKVHKLKPKTRKQIKKNFGKSLGECYKILFPKENVEVLSETHLTYQEKNLNLSKPFANVKNALSDLKKRGFKIAAITTRSKRTSVKSLKVNKIASYFDLVISREDIVNPKPHPESIIKALEFFKINPKYSIMVGDTIEDIKAGKNAKIKTIGITHGPLGNKIKQANPDILISDISEIITLINY